MSVKQLPLLISRFAGRLRFPQLFALTAALFVIDVLVPDVIPFADEILLALATLLLGSWQKRRSEGDTDTAAPGTADDPAEESATRN